MGTKVEIKHLSGWQLLKTSGSDADYGQENESSEEDEYNFYRLAGNDHNALEIEKGE